MGKTWPFSAFSKKSEDDDDVMIIDEDEEDLIGDEISTNDQEQTKQNQTKVSLKNFGGNLFPTLNLE